MNQKTLYDEFIELAERESGRNREEITCLWWNNRDGRLNGLVEIDGVRRQIGGIPSSVGNAEIMKSVISAGLHIHYKDDTASNTDEVLSLAITIKELLAPLYPLADKDWSEVLRDIGTYADCLT